MMGYEKLKAAVEHDCNDKNACGCFNPDGCNVKNQRLGEYGQDGYKHCFHAYCDKFKWIIDRAKHYADKTGVPWDDLLTSWENDRDYWYMNYYQDGRQPEIKADTVKVFESADEMITAIGEPKFRCPACGGISSSPYVCNSGRDIRPGKKCDWKVYGLFGDLGKGIFVFCKKELRGENMFMPISWEEINNG